MTDARHQIERLLVAYVSRIDAGDLAGVGALFAHAEIWDTSGGIVRGSRAVEDRLREWVRIYPDGTPRTRHLLSNVLIDADESAGTATASSSVLVLQAVEGELALQPLFVGGYDDDFECADGTWRFTRRRRRADLVGDLSQHRA